MSTRYYYNYHPLDKLLQEEASPEDIGDQLDAILLELVSHACKDNHYIDQIEEHYYTLRQLRDFFWQVEASEKNKS
jgi:hypothetical protein